MRSTRTTPAPWAGATSPTTHWWTSTARYSRARAGGITKAVEGSHTGGFNNDTWGVAMIGDFDVVPPTPIQLRTVARLLGWRMAMDGVDPRGTVTLTSARRGVHPVPARRARDAADDLHPPRRRGHRLPGQRRIRRDGPHPRHGRAVQRPARTTGTRRLAARRRDLRPLAGDGRHEQPGWARRRRRSRLPTGDARYVRFAARRGVLVAAVPAPTP